MNRKNFIANTLMAFAVTLVPRILQPSLPEVMEDEVVEVSVVWKTYAFNGSDGFYQVGDHTTNDYNHTIQMKTSEYEFIKNKAL